MAGEQIDKLLNRFQSHLKLFAALTTIALCVIAVGNVWTFYENYIYVPTVSVVSFDFENIVAQILINNKTTCTLYGNDLLYVGGAWGIRFGTTGLASAGQYDTIELVKNGMVYNILQYKNPTVATAAVAATTAVTPPVVPLVPTT